VSRERAAKLRRFWGVPSEATASDRRRPLFALLGVIALLTAWNLVGRPDLPLAAHLPGGLVVAAMCLLVGFAGGLGVAQMGLAPRALGAGFKYGAVAMGLIGAVVIAGTTLSAAKGLFHTPKAEIDAARLWFEALIAIPLGTVLVEELAFRGALLGLLRGVMATTPAVILDSVLFGLWHLQPVVAATHGTVIHVCVAVAGTFLVTLAGGVGFCWLRLRSGSLLASIMAHIATNSFGLIASWLVIH
jgi:uncharacterized protein